MKSVQQRIDDSRQYLGSGMTRMLSPVITDKAYADGWRYLYPSGICYHGERYTDLGLTLDMLEFHGIITLKLQTVTII